uniref:Dual oxidase maturation factor 1 n=1 Tax=Photinus pyralis TaxID=7054 RepID=A0A1Y1M2Q4_PHOPY
MRGWFDAFRYDGGPTLYNFNNRTAVTGDVTLITFLAIFCTLYVAFLIVFPGIRKERFTTFFFVTLSLFVGGTIVVTMVGSAWHVGCTAISSTYRAFSKEKINASLGVHIGLRHVNVTLHGNSSYEIDFNEQFMWLTSDKMGTTFKEAIKRGLPFPILTVAEYFSLGQEGLSWGGQYRAAGYFGSVMLWFVQMLSWSVYISTFRASLVTWLLMNLMILVVPRYGALLMTFCGILLLATACGYFGMLPEAPLIIHLEGSAIYLHLGWCFWLVFIAGSVCLFTGVIITIIEIVYPHSFSTILEVNYDTPYDRHIIIEDSHGKRFQKKRSSNNSKLEEPTGFSSRILRRLSSKTRESEKQGIDSPAFELSTPKSSWRYPYQIGEETATCHRNFLNGSSSNVSPIQKSISRLKPSKAPDDGLW